MNIFIRWEETRNLNGEVTALYVMDRSLNVTMRLSEQIEDAIWRNRIVHGAQEKMRWRQYLAKDRQP